MEYRLLLWPHANARYRQGMHALAHAELSVMLDAYCPGTHCEADGLFGIPCLTFQTQEPLTEEAVRAFRTHSLFYGLFGQRPDGSLMPVAGRAEACLGEDLPGILKYKGKTNELFMQMMLNIALYSGDFLRSRDALRVLDPMCGRATAPFIALNRGWNAVGADLDRTGLKEAEVFFRRYLEFHRFKHASDGFSRTLRGGSAAKGIRFEVGDTPEHFKRHQTISLELLHLDVGRLGEAFGRNAFHIVLCDLPYGVQHEARSAGDDRSGKGRTEALLSRAAEGFRTILRPGGTAAVSFNAQTFPLEKARRVLEESGLEVMRGGAYDHFEHWVEQAITRDLAVCRKPASH